MITSVDELWQLGGEKRDSIGNNRGVVARIVVICREFSCESPGKAGGLLIRAAQSGCLGALRSPLAPHCDLHRQADWGI